MQIGIIAEGASELRILKHIIGRYLGTEHDINEIQPKTDVGGVQIIPGGWDRVIKTFESLDLVKNALIENDYILIQIDTDYAQTHPFSVNIMDDNGQCYSEKILHDRITDRILNNIPNLSKEEQDRILLAICNNEIECWLLPIYYNDKHRCKTSNCIQLLNNKLVQNKIRPITDKNCTKARMTYNAVLQNLRKSKDIENVSQYSFGFQFLVNQLKKIKDISTPLY